MSQVHYKFKAAKDYSSIVFDGLAISAFDLKQEILKANKLNPESFDLVLSNAQTNDEYAEDNSLIPRNTSVFVRRIPGKPGKSGLTGAPAATTNSFSSGPNSGSGGGGGGYTSAASRSYGGSGTGANAPIKDQSAPAASTGSRYGAPPALTEDEQIQQMFQQSSQQWEQQAEELATNHMRNTRYRPQARASAAPYQVPASTRPLPPSYVCHRCGQKGHWIRDCPSAADKNGPQKRFSRTTGIPKSFLQKVDSLPDDRGAMVTDDGEMVVAQANDAAWQKAQKYAQHSVATEDALEGISVPVDLACSLCHRLLRDAMTTPCCQAAFCDECITRALLDRDPERHFTCPSCRQTGIVPDMLQPHPDLRQRVERHIRQWVTSRGRSDSTEPTDSRPATSEGGSGGNGNRTGRQRSRFDRPGKPSTQSDQGNRRIEVFGASSNAPMYPPSHQSSFGPGGYRPPYQPQPGYGNPHMGYGRPPYPGSAGYPMGAGMPMNMGHVPHNYGDFTNHNAPYQANRHSNGGGYGPGSGKQYGQANNPGYGGEAPPENRPGSNGNDRRPSSRSRSPGSRRH
ncbi:Retinoblastoma-binding protein [Tieghemiomyces parasiticus]|uniref:Retinoblastoma-binding protein n=1 Tax=Tieghemiomyces parasiticus TaxID=78921 RepID=A0A9W8AAN5_9FUNG|nr:Retinoblastoma-binding protein [Tieghemiomyces parasiticus]